MARPPSPYQAAKVKQRETGRPILVILAIVAVALGFYLWTQSGKSDVDMTSGLTGDAEPSAETAAPPPAKKPEAPRPPDLEEWWSDVEPELADAMEAGQNAAPDDCDDLESAVDSLRQYQTRSEPPISASYGSLVTALDRAATGCRDGQAAVITGSVTSAKQHLKSLVRAAASYNLPEPTLLADYL